MAILNIVFGSLFLLCYLCGGVSLIMQSAAGNGGLGGRKDQAAEIADHLKAEVPGYAVYQVGNVVVNLALSILLLICGIGLLGMNQWARVGSIVYAITAILTTLGGLVYQLAVVNPVMNRYLEAMLRAQAGQRGPDASFLLTIITAATVIVAILLMIYAIVLLVMMLLPRVRAAFASGPLGGGPLADRPGDAGDENEDRPRRSEWDY